MRILKPAEGWLRRRRRPGALDRTDVDDREKEALWRLHPADEWEAKLREAMAGPPRNGEDRLERYTSESLILRSGAEGEGGGGGGEAAQQGDGDREARWRRAERTSLWERLRYDDEVGREEGGAGHDEDNEELR